MFEQTILACKVIEPRKCVQHLAALTTREETRMAANQPTTVVENWKPVVGFEGLYEVSAAQVREIRAKLAKGGNQCEIAEAYGVTQANVSCINLGKSWRRLSHE